jgi:hypothetical protein
MSYRMGQDRGVHDKKVMSHAALCSVLRSQKS